MRIGKCDWTAFAVPIQFFSHRSPHESRVKLPLQLHRRPESARERSRADECGNMRPQRAARLQSLYQWFDHLRVAPAVSSQVNHHALDSMGVGEEEEIARGLCERLFGIVVAFV